MAKLPIVTPTEKFDIRFINGQPVFDLREQIINILMQDTKLGSFREFFAEPIVNHSEGEISWYSHGGGEVRSFANLTHEERNRVSESIRDIDQKLKATADKLSKASQQSAWLGDAMRSMLLVPNLEQSIFLVGDRPVLCQWGCVPFGSDPNNFDMVNQNWDIVVRDSSTAIPVVPEPPLRAAEPPQAGPPPESLLTAAESPLAAPEPPEAVSSPQPQPPPAAPVSQPHYWRGLLPLLLALLLLLLLLLGIYLTYIYRFHYLVPGYNVAIDRERGDIDRLWGAIEEKSRQCPAPVPPVDFNPVPDVPEGGSDATLNVPPIGSDEVERRLETNNIPIGEEVNVSLAWNSPDDLDLAVRDPRGEVIFFKTRSSSTGGTLDIDVHANCNSRTSTPIENISWDILPLAGVYTIDVSLYNQCGNTNPEVPFTLIIKQKNARETQVEGTVGATRPRYVYEFNVEGQ